MLFTSLIIFMHTLLFKMWSVGQPHLWTLGAFERWELLNPALPISWIKIYILTRFLGDFVAFSKLVSVQEYLIKRAAGASFPRHNCLANTWRLLERCDLHLMPHLKKKTLIYILSFNPHNIPMKLLSCSYYHLFTDEKAQIYQGEIMYSNQTTNIGTT